MDLLVYRNHLVRPSVRPSFYVIVSGPYIFIEKHRKFLLYIKIFYNLMACHDFDPWSFGQFYGHWKDKCKIPFRSISFLWNHIKSFLKIYLFLCLKIRVRCITFYEETLKIHTSHKDCFLPEGVS